MLTEKGAAAQLEDATTVLGQFFFIFSWLFFIPHSGVGRKRMMHKDNDFAGGHMKQKFRGELQRSVTRRDGR